MKPSNSEPERRWLIVVRCDNATAMTSTLKSVTQILERISIGKTHLAFNSKDATVAGVYAKIAKPSAVIRSMLEGTATTFDKGFVLVLELGDDFNAVGNNTGWVWLQQH
jgi:hypothetical protein